MTLQVNVVEARGLAAADSNGFSDPYAIVFLGMQSMKTKVKPKTLNPVWQEIFNLANKNDDTLLVEVWDWDAIGSDDFLGQVRIPLRGLTDDSPVWYPLAPRDAKDTNVKGEIRLRIRMVNLQASKSVDMIVQHVKQRLNALSRTSRDISDYDDEGYLDLTALSLAKIPPDALNLIADANQRNLDLSFNAFTSLPDLTALRPQILNLSGCPLVEINTCGYMTTITQLILNGAQLTEIPPAIGKLKFLEKLQIGNNQVSKIPAEIGRLAKLEELSLTGNPIKKIPPQMGGLYSLEILDLSNCELTALPEEFTLATRLMELNLGNNQLSKLPDGIGRMTRLVSLNIMDNDITDLPLSIGYCIGLGKLGSGIALARNPISSREMFAKYEVGVDHLLDYLEKRLAFAGSPQVPPLSLPEDFLPVSEKRGSQGPLATTNTPPSTPPPVRQAAPATPPQVRAAHNQAATALAQGSVEEQLGKKVIVLKNWAITTLLNELRPKLMRMKSTVFRVDLPFPDLMAIGQAMREIKAEADKALAITGPRPPAQFIPTPADRVEALRYAVSDTCEHVIFVLDGLNRVLQVTVQTNEVLQIVGHLKVMKPFIDAAPPK